MTRRLLRLLPVCLFAAGLLWPLAWVVAHGWTLTGRYEESIGYRYFYSLRAVYGEDEFVFLPQGQLVEVVDQVIQRLLTVAGYPPEVMFPRIDLFAYLAVAVPHLLTVAVFAWAVAPLATLSTRFLAAAFWLLVYYLPGAFGGYVILQPDYHPWVLTVGLATAGAFARWPATLLEWRLGRALVLGAFAGLAVGVKLTLAIFPLTLGLAWLLLRRGKSESIAMALCAVTVGQCVWLFVLLVQYQGDLLKVLHFFKDLSTWIQMNSPFLSEGQRPAYTDWLRWVFTDVHALGGPVEDLAWEGPWMVRIALLSPALLAMAAALLRRQPGVPALVALAVGGAAYHWVVYSRFVAATWFEAATFLQLVLWAAAMVGMWRVGALPWNWAAFGASLLAILVSIQPVVDYLSRIETNDAAGRRLRRVLETAPSPTAFLIPENAYRPLSMDSAVFKGGRNVFEFEGEWVSPMVRRLVPGREYFVRPRDYYREYPARLRNFSTVVFTVYRGMDREAQKANLMEYYSAPLFLFHCDREVGFEDRRVVVCSRGMTMRQYLESALGVPVREAIGEKDQYLISAPQGTVDFSRIGTVHADLGYAVGVTLRGGFPVGFRYEPPLGGQERH